jgi:hypothetical protein
MREGRHRNGSGIAKGICLEPQPEEPWITREGGPFGFAETGRYFALRLSAGGWTGRL